MLYQAGSGSAGRGIMQEHVWRPSLKQAKQYRVCCVNRS